MCAKLQALNEGKCIAETLQVVQSLHPPPHEVIVVDGGSTDRSVIHYLMESTFVCNSDRHQQTDQLTLYIFSMQRFVAHSNSS